MAPSAEALEAALISAANAIFKAEPDETTVNKVRKQAESDLDLDDDFFLGAKWKSRSKNVIKEHVEKLVEGDVQPEETKNGVKRQSEDASPPPAKRRKAAKKEDSAELSEEEQPRPKKHTTKTKSKPKVKAEDSDEEEEEVKPKKKAVPRRRKVTSPLSDEEEDEDEDMDDSEEKEESNNFKPEDSISAASTDSAKNETSEDNTAAKADVNPGEETDYSDVIDEPPKPKRQKKTKSAAKTEKPKKEPKARAKKASSPDDPNEAEIKKLQGHLVKCGVRKLWHNELKEHGDDAKAKIRHLKKMLTDIGMDGRFSESKASEIKERRELLADLEATQEMNALWGSTSGGRPTRGRGQPRKPLKEESDSDDAQTKPAKDDSDSDAEAKGEGDYKAENGNKDNESDDEESFAARSRRARADLAFLDDSDSD